MTEKEENQAGYGEFIRNLLWLGITIIAVYLFARVTGVDAMRDRVAASGVWGPLIVIALKASTIVIAPLGGSPLYPIAGAAFGFWFGFIYTFIGDLLGAAIAFYISRVFGRKIVRYFVTGPGMKIVDAVLVYLGTTRGLLQARLVFFSFPEGVTYAAGLTAIPFWKFLAVVVPVGILPHIVLVASGEALSRYAATLHPIVLVSGYMVIVGIMAGGGYWFYRRAQKYALDL
ncbi:MAG: TVP38/TMEM64 family protein [Candidatus Sungbacteria bacterium]|nr:TVP38/TMEM64 family protein [Candidatus Sungbacteria bacterium]